MNKTTFRKNLLLAIRELHPDFPIDDESVGKFIITPKKENGKSYNSTDDYIRLWVMNDKNLKGRELSLSEVISFFEGMFPLCPVWIKINTIKSNSEDEVVFNLITSLRNRKPSVVMNTGSKYPPFFIDNDI
ncbi:hypothetical protein [Serratia fonticola]|uniref:hypothetical protein n=1 Tax=Serratia fonticola TaxID=47917 RepID=UPI000587D5E7|nr:hypothetical protein [Serratia fonticola]ALX92462.1 hypothetical protein AV650_02295 [Serratia fonticola]MBC3250891.1 hypothetical protein [Serratia fonticola]QIP91995.1 hypothetical protein HAP32_02514 [Serratia fonticola]RDL17792.1 hypothetical protein DFO62_11690 [Serratia fonticola]